MGYSKNVKIYYYYSTFAELLILGPILVLYLTAKGLSFAEIMALQSVSAVGTFFFEVPTGAVADRIGRKQSILLGAITWAISLTIYIVGKSFVIFIIAELIFSLGSAFKSGADSALIYDSLKAEGREKEYQGIEGKARSYALYAQAIGSVIAGYVYEINIFLPMIISVIFMLVTALITMSFKEPPLEEEGSNTSGTYFKQICESGTHVLTHEKLKAIVLYSMVFSIFYRAGYWYYQPYMETVKIPVRYFGIIFFVFNITAAFFSKKSSYIMEKTKPKTLTFMAFVMIASFAIMGVVKAWVGVLAILLQQIARGINRPVLTKYMNKHIPSDKRATILSFQSLCCNIAIAVTFPLLGIMKDHTNIFTNNLILAASMTILTLAAIKYMDSRLGLDHKAKKSKVKTQETGNL